MIFDIGGQNDLDLRSQGTYMPQRIFDGVDIVREVDQIDDEPEDMSDKTPGTAL